jgi:Pectinacetylesterase
MPISHDRSRTNNRHVIAGALVAFAVILSACSGDDSDDAGDRSTRDLSADEQSELEDGIEFARCRREHGYEDYPDPQVSGDYLLNAAPFGAGEEWNAAQEACIEVDEEPGSEDGAGAAAAWQHVAPGGDCECSDGSEYSFWVREADPSKVVLFLQGGGNCFSAETCAADGYDRTVDPEEDDPARNGGIFDFSDERNPFADYSVVNVPYCTGDVHLGNAITDYEPGVTVHHKGFVNGTAALDHLVTAFPGATDVVVMGESAGSVATPLYAGLVSDRLPDARITVLADGSGASLDSPDLNARLVAAWGAETTIPAWPENAGLTAAQWSAQQLFIQSGLHDAGIVFARHDYAYDEQQSGAASYFDLPATDLLSLIDANETHIEAAGVNLRSYVAPGDGHTVLSDGAFYSEEVNGQSLVDWVTRLIAGEPVDDVHCVDCAARAEA